MLNKAPAISLVLHIPRAAIILIANLEHWLAIRIIRNDGAPRLIIVLIADFNDRPCPLTIIPTSIPMSIPGIAIILGTVLINGLTPDVVVCSDLPPRKRPNPEIIGIIRHIPEIIGIKSFQNKRVIVQIISSRHSLPIKIEPIVPTVELLMIVNAGGPILETSHQTAIDIVIAGPMIPGTSQRKEIVEGSGIWRRQGGIQRAISYIPRIKHRMTGSKHRECRYNTPHTRPKPISYEANPRRRQYPRLPIIRSHHTRNKTTFLIFRTGNRKPPGVIILIRYRDKPAHAIHESA